MIGSGYRRQLQGAFPLEVLEVAPLLELRYPGDRRRGRSERRGNMGAAGQGERGVRVVSDKTLFKIRIQTSSSFILAHDLNSPDPRDDKVSEHFCNNVDGNSLLQLPSIGRLLPFACALGGHCGR